MSSQAISDEIPIYAVVDKSKKTSNRRVSQEIKELYESTPNRATGETVLESRTKSFGTGNSIYDVVKEETPVDIRYTPALGSMESISSIHRLPPSPPPVSRGGILNGNRGQYDEVMLSNGEVQNQQPFVSRTVPARECTTNGIEASTGAADTGSVAAKQKRKGCIDMVSEKSVLFLSCILILVIVVLSVACALLISALLEIAALRSRVNMLENPNMCGDDLGTCNATALTQQTIDIAELRFNLSMLRDQYCTVTDCRAINQTLRSSLREVDERQQQLAQTLEHLGLPFSPVPSCAALLAFSPTTPSGYYWVRAGNGSAVRVYCDMTMSCGNITGGWMRVTSLNTSNTSTQCPGNFSLTNTTNIQLCGIEIGSAMTRRSRCSSATFSLSGILYSRVCGHVRAYQLGSPETFHSGKTVNDSYVDGVSLTHGSPQRRHIWSWAAASSNTSLCPCDRTNPPLPFVGQDYFCDTASQESSSAFSDFSNPLWDGEDCVSGNSCCSFNNPPWFHKQLPEPTTDDMEMRVCADEFQANEYIGIESFEIYVHQTN